MTKLNSNAIIGVVDSLLGDITAVGESNKDEIVMKNLKTAIDIVNWLLDGIADSAKTRHRFEGSMRAVGETAFSAMCEWKNWLEDTINLD